MLNSSYLASSVTVAISLLVHGFEGRAAAQQRENRRDLNLNIIQILWLSLRFSQNSRLQVS